MSRFNSYARKVDEIAKQAFEEYRKAEKDLKRAEENARNTPNKGGFVDAEYMAKYARAQAELAEAKNAYSVARHRMAAKKTEIAALKRELNAAIDDYYAADPAQMDEKTLELLKSGILSASEYTRLMNKAIESGNHTMARMIGKYATDAGEKIAEKYGKTSPQAMELRAVEYTAMQNNGGDRREAFEVMSDLYDRCVNNPGMINHWDDIISETVQNF